MPDASDLPTRRINRLLRPLRNRCTALAAFTAREPLPAPPPATYSSRLSGTSGSHPDTPPLLVLPPPNATGTRMYSDKRNLDLSLRIYAIRDCFEDITVNTKGRSRNAGTHEIEGPFMGLGALCATVIGQNMQAQLQTDDDDVVWEDTNTDVIGDLYEFIPSQYRRRTLLAHGLDIILENCPHHPTLLSVLLDVCLTHNLVYEAEALLRALLGSAIALHPTQTSGPRLCHPAHSNFLVDHYERWNAAGSSGRTFARLVVEVLHKMQSPEAWVCKAMNKFAQAIWTKDFLSFMYLVSDCMATAAGEALKGVASAVVHKATALNNQLRKWVNRAVDHSFSPSATSSKDEDNLEHCEGTLGFLELVLARGMCKNPYKGNDTTSPPDASAAIVCLATHWLSKWHNILPPTQFAPVVHLLRGVIPQTSTYNHLVTNILAHKTPINELREALYSCTAALRSHRLLHLEASLWACTLHHVEIPDYERLLSRCNGEARVRKYRHQLIDLVDDAEKRCFGLSINDTNKNVFPKDTSFLTKVEDCEWSWEPMIGSWVRQTCDNSPPKKRTKLKHDHTPRSSRRLLIMDHNADSSRHYRKANSSTSILRTSSKRSSPRSSSLVTSPLLTEESENASPGIEGKEKRGQKKFLNDALSRRSSNFSSLLFDALSRRVVLHPKATMIISHDNHRSSMDDWGGDQDFVAFQVPPSDDSLDLFACASSSSPVRR